MISKAELQHLLASTKSSHVERTISTNDMDKFCQAIRAFSNDVSGSGKNGYFIIGAHNDGKPSGLKVNDKLLLKTSNIRTDGNILPQPVMNVESRGVYRVQKELVENGNGKAVFDFSLVTAFRVIENVSEKYLEEGLGAENAKEKPKKSPRKIEEEIMMIMENNPQVTRKELAKKLDRTEDSIRYYLRKMTKQGIIKHEGPTKSGKWVIIK